MSSVTEAGALVLWTATVAVSVMLLGLGRQDRRNNRLYADRLDRLEARMDEAEAGVQFLTLVVGDDAKSARTAPDATPGDDE